MKVTLRSIKKITKKLIVRLLAKDIKQKNLALRIEEYLLETTTNTFCSQFRRKNISIVKIVPKIVLRLNP